MDDLTDTPPTVEQDADFLDDPAEKMRGRLQELHGLMRFYDNPWWEEYRAFLEKSLAEAKDALVECDVHDVPQINLLQGTARDLRAQIDRPELIRQEMLQIHEELRNIAANPE